MTARKSTKTPEPGSPEHLKQLQRLRKTIKDVTALPVPPANPAHVYEQKTEMLPDEGAADPIETTGSAEYVYGDESEPTPPAQDKTTINHYTIDQEGDKKRTTDNHIPYQYARPEVTMNWRGIGVGAFFVTGAIAGVVGGHAFFKNQRLKTLRDEKRAQQQRLEGRDNQPAFTVSMDSVEIVDGKAYVFGLKPSDIQQDTLAATKALQASFHETATLTVSAEDAHDWGAAAGVGVFGALAMTMLGQKLFAPRAPK